MAMKHPKEILRDFHEIISKLRDSKDLTSAECKQIADDLTEVYNYVGQTSENISQTNVMYAVSGQVAKRGKQLNYEIETINNAQQFIEDNFDKAEQYFRAIQLGGYAAFFGLWSISSKALPDPFWLSISLVLMFISCSAFIIWELNKTRKLALALKRHAAMSAGKLEQSAPLKSPMIKPPQEKSTRSVLTEDRPTYLIMSILPAFVAVVIVLWQLLGGIAKGLFG